jgi:hypothetical protein
MKVFISSKIPHGRSGGTFIPYWDLNLRQRIGDRNAYHSLAAGCAFGPRRSFVAVACRLKRLSPCCSENKNGRL